jgi:hypothetical protein
VGRLLPVPGMFTVICDISHWYKTGTYMYLFDFAESNDGNNEC